MSSASRHQTLYIPTGVYAIEYDDGVADPSQKSIFASNLDSNPFIAKIHVNPAIINGGV
jgi:hypothetical protein